MRYLSWEEAIGRPGILIFESMLCGREIKASEVDGLFDDNKKDPKIFFFKGTIFDILANEPCKALQCYKYALDLGLGGIEACLIRIKHCPEEGGINGGIAYLKKSIHKFQKSTEKEILNGKIGFLLYLEGSFEESANYYERAYNLNNRVEWINGMACSIIKMGDIHKGKEMLEKAASKPHIPKIINDNYNKASLLSEGMQGFHLNLNGIIDNISRCDTVAEEIRTLVSSASDLGLILESEITSYEQLIALADGEVPEAIVTLSSKDYDLKSCGSSVQSFIFEKIFNYIIGRLPSSYSSAARKAIQNNCSSHTIQEELIKWESTYGYANKALKWAITTHVQSPSSEDGEIHIEDLIKAIKYDSINLKRVLDKDPELLSILRKPLVEERVVETGSQMIDATLERYRSDVACNTFNNHNPYFDNLKSYYDAAKALFPSNPDLLEDYAYILKLIRSRESLPQAIQIYEQIIEIEPSRKEKMIELIENCKRTLDMVR